MLVPANPDLTREEQDFWALRLNLPLHLATAVVRKIGLELPDYPIFVDYAERQKERTRGRYETLIVSRTMWMACYGESSLGPTFESMRRYGRPSPTWCGIITVDETQKRDLENPTRF